LCLTGGCSVRSGIEDAAYASAAAPEPPSGGRVSGTAWYRTTCLVPSICHEAFSPRQATPPFLQKAGVHT
jgi:hypothetical protein